MFVAGGGLLVFVLAIGSRELSKPYLPRQINPGEERLFMYECMKHQTTRTCFNNWDNLKR